MEKCPKCPNETLKQGTWGAHVWRACTKCGYQYRVGIIGLDDSKKWDNYK